MNPAPIESLPNELLKRILDHIQPDPERTVPIDDRSFLSVESFDYTPPSNADRDIRRFRCTCRRFAEVGEPLLFTIVGVRFSKGGLQKLEELAGWPHLTRHVKKFSYLVPYYYPSGTVSHFGTQRVWLTRHSRESSLPVAGEWQHQSRCGRIS